MMVKQEHWISAAGCNTIIVWCTKYSLMGEVAEYLRARRDSEEACILREQVINPCPSLHNCSKWSPSQLVIQCDCEVHERFPELKKLWKGNLWNPPLWHMWSTKETIKVYREAEGEMLTYKFRLYPTNE